MKYVFICNGRKDKAFVVDEIDRQLEKTCLKAEKYITTDTGDATRYVNFYCDLNPKDEVCFVACGGAGLTNEVMNALVGRTNKYLAILFIDGTNDFVKVYPDRDFSNIHALLAGERKLVDVIKLNDNYALNCASLGMDAMICSLAQQYSFYGDKDPYNHAIRNSFLFYRFHRLDIKVDGKKLKLKRIQNSQISNGRYTGGEFLAAPNAEIDDGLLDCCFFKVMPATFFLIILKHFRKGTHLTNKFCRHFLVSRKAKHIEVASNKLITVGIDGEVFATSYLDIQVVEKSLNLILPAQTVNDPCREAAVNNIYEK